MELFCHKSRDMREPKNLGNQMSSRTKTDWSGTKQGFGKSIKRKLQLSILEKISTWTINEKIGIETELRIARSLHKW